MSREIEIEAVFGDHPDQPTFDHKKPLFNELMKSANESKDVDQLIEIYNTLVYHKYKFPLIQHWFAAEFLRDKTMSIMYDDQLKRDYQFFKTCENLLSYFDNILHSEIEFRKNS